MYIALMYCQSPLESKTTNAPAISDLYTTVKCAISQEARVINNNVTLYIFVEGTCFELEPRSLFSGRGDEAIDREKLNANNARKH